MKAARPERRERSACNDQAATPAHHWVARRRRLLVLIY
jgi:hypothetical protein